MSHRILCVLPALPDRTTGGGVLLYETLIYLLTRGTVQAVVPVASHLGQAFAALQSDPALAALQWHPLPEARAETAFARACRLLGPAPVEVAKFATPAHQAVLERARQAFEPTTELLISSRAAAPYRGFALPPTARLYMMDIDPQIVRYDGPSLKRRLTTALEQPKVERLCRRVLAAAGRVGTISAADIAELNRMGRRTDVRHVPPLMRPQPVDRSHVDPFHVLITTNFTYRPNVTSLQWFLEACWPHVDARARLTVTGLDAGDALRHLCAATPRVAYAGCLPRPELDALFGSVSVAVNPTRSGSGFQIKLLDALARGVPIVSTAFSNRVGPALASSDDPLELARLINARLGDDATPAFDYEAFHAHAVAAWDAFLFE